MLNKYNKYKRKNKLKRWKEQWKKKTQLDDAENELSYVEAAFHSEQSVFKCETLAQVTLSERAKEQRRRVGVE